MIELMNVKMKGKIVSSELYNGKHYTVLQTPAKDTYSQPSEFKVSSVINLGSVGDEVNINCNMSGYIKRKPYLDKNTGQQKVYEDVNVYLDAELDSSVKSLKSA